MGFFYVRGKMGKAGGGTGSSGSGKAQADVPGTLGSAPLNSQTTLRAAGLGRDGGINWEPLICSHRT